MWRHEIYESKLCVCVLGIPMWIYIAASVNLITAAVFEVQQDCQMSVMLIIIFILGVPKSPVHLYIMQCDIWRWTRVLWHLVPVDLCNMRDMPPFIVTYAPVILVDFFSSNFYLIFRQFALLHRNMTKKVLILFNWTNVKPRIANPS